MLDEVCLIISFKLPDFRLIHQKGESYNVYFCGSMEWKRLQKNPLKSQNLKPKTPIIHSFRKTKLVFLLIYFEVQQLAINFKSEFTSLRKQLQNSKNMLH